MRKDFIINRKNKSINQWWSKITIIKNDDSLYENDFVDDNYVEVIVLLPLMIELSAKRQNKIGNNHSNSINLCKIFIKLWPQTI